MTPNRIIAAIIAAAILGFLFGAAMFAVPCHAAPPPPASDDAATMAPFGAIIRGMTQPANGISCCDVSDCRPVEWRIKGDHYEAFIAHLTADGSGFASGPDKYVEVPAYAVEPPEKRLPLAVACWSKSRGGLTDSDDYYCFSPAGGT